MRLNDETMQDLKNALLLVLCHCDGMDVVTITPSAGEEEERTTGLAVAITGWLMIASC